MEQQELIPHLFRTEYRKIIAVLCKHFGLEHMGIAEDIASDTFLTAAQVWPMHGIPINPVAWLYNVAGNKAKNYLRRHILFENKIAPQVKTDAHLFEYEPDLSHQNIADSQLQMMFAICHPSIPQEAQIGLSLRILCGFGIEEVADAFLASKDAINKRLYRAKEKLREEKIKIELPAPSEIDARLDTVLTTIYLLFSEGYYSVSRDRALRKEVCLEAMRLCHMLIEDTSTNKPQVNALMALMCFHSSRFDARVNKNGEWILYEDQNTELWDVALVSKGIYFLNCAARGDRLTNYHLEAMIAYWSTQKTDTKEKWEAILQLYDSLLRVQYSPVAALNRTFALAKAKSKATAITEAEHLNLTNNQFYYALLGELYTGIDNSKAIQNLQEALLLAKTQADKQVIQNKMAHLAHI